MIKTIHKLLTKKKKREKSVGVHGSSVRTVTSPFPFFRKSIVHDTKGHKKIKKYSSLHCSYYRVHYKDKRAAKITNSQRRVKS